MEGNSTEQVWQVEAGGQVYDATFRELEVWIAEGSLLPDDKVRKGNLRWIEARKVPGLSPFFNMRKRGETMPLTVAETAIDSGTTAAHLEIKPRGESGDRSDPISKSAAKSAADFNAANYCAIHPEIESFYVCEACCNGFCKACPRSYGGSVKICPKCGEMCRPIDGIRAAARKDAVAAEALQAGFGISDLFAALSHPFRFKSSLFFGASMFALFSIGQSVTALGGMFMFASAIICLMFANMLVFGVLSNTVERFVQGDLDSNFMPGFDDFSLLDDVVHPFFVSIAAYIVSFGPFLVTAIVGIYLLFSSVSSQMETFQSEIERLPGTHYYTGREPIEQSKQVKRILGDAPDDHEPSLDLDSAAATSRSSVVLNGSADDDLEMWNQLQEARKKELEAAFGKTTETREEEFNNMVRGILSLAAPLVIIGGIAFLWGLFFFPAACAVAGYSRSFSATINPLVGLDTIRRLGLSYFKILSMGSALAIISLLTGGIFALLFSPFELPGMGNIPAKFLSSFVTFYLFVVFSCIIGYALFKNAHKLDLAR